MADPQGSSFKSTIAPKKMANDTQPTTSDANNGDSDKGGANTSSSNGQASAQAGFRTTSDHTYPGSQSSAKFEMDLAKKYDD